MPVEGTPYTAQWLGAAGQGKLAFAATKEQTFDIADLVCWGEFAQQPLGPFVVLAGGGLLVGTVRDIGRDALTLETDRLGTLTLPLDAVQAALLHPPGDSHRRDQLVARLTSGGGKLDRVMLDNGDELTGTSIVLHDEALSLTDAAGNAEIEQMRVAALAFRSVLRVESPAGLRVIVGLDDGSRLSCTSLESDAEHVQATVVGGMHCQCDLSHVVALQVLGGRAIFLSDLEPVGYKHLPFLQLPWPYRRDRNVAGDQLRADGKLYLKGLGMHSASRLTYDLDRSYRRLEAELAIDDAAGSDGSVVFRVVVDKGDGRWQPKFASGVVRGGDHPLPISVDLTGAKRLSLLVEFADRGDERDDADWLSARLIP